ncbi:MAG: ABC transporter permease [Proteobacteria bacterium]|jgi:phospholipid/cholesterol/gamma-HCH transport system permease protein|nr:MlaE family lipid ABC transporter permease subunit [Desulfocapsa sp.]MBU3944303.1 ABC transporter permease [Pseudomonadota bacterium]MCG2743881.1 ABC transporter permease [Desulfobacteraceae bacterium]MBU4030393.1 ABC transporter permease [Pseudomonadota bacterium]MBU4042788.1 ABC transporter permease [Pseudomonadota bacterium]
MGDTSSHKGQIGFIETSSGVMISSSGDWVIEGLRDVDRKLEHFAGKASKMSVQWDVSAVGRVDSAGMMLFIRYYDLLQNNDCTIEIIGADADYDTMYRLLRQYVSAPSVAGPTFSSRFLRIIHELGRDTVSSFVDMIAFLSFLGENFIIFLLALRHPLSIRYGAIVKNIEEAGVRAMPIVALTSFLIGVVIAYQGAVQLEKFGAHIFIVDMISISVTRELAPLITAIVVAGRTGSSYTAQIGVMKITEEIDAMRTMGFDPLLFLVQPRIIALMIVMPLMIFFADMVGILAGMFISNIHLNLSYGEFLRRLQVALEVKHVWIGLFKGPFFAFLIAAIACFRGFQVSKSTESIGRYTAISVVNAIFLVIACDALFSVLFTELGI